MYIGNKTVLFPGVIYMFQISKTLKVYIQKRDGKSSVSPLVEFTSNILSRSRNKTCKRH